MKITAIETYWTQTPFDMGGKPKALGGLNWQSMNTVWLRVMTDAGIDGWGEAFGHATAAAIYGRPRHPTRPRRPRSGRSRHRRAASPAVANVPPVWLQRPARLRHIRYGHRPLGYRRQIRQPATLAPARGHPHRDPDLLRQPAPLRRGRPGCRRMRKGGHPRLSRRQAARDYHFPKLPPAATPSATTRD